jgi:hypothetical protein
MCDMGDKKKFMEGLLMKPDNVDDDRLNLLWERTYDEVYRRMMVGNCSNVRIVTDHLIHGIKKMDDGTKFGLEDNTV